MKAKNCCEKMKMAQDMGMMMSDTPIPGMPFGFCMEMEYCPWCGAKIEEAPEKHRYTVVFVERKEGDVYAEDRNEAERIAKELWDEDGFEHARMAEHKLYVYSEGEEDEE